MTAFIKRGSRGGHRGSGPLPWDLSEVGSCVEAWCVGEGAQRLFLPYYYLLFFWLASLPVLLQTYYMYTYFQVQCSVWNGHPFYIFPLSKLWKETNFSSLAVMKGPFSHFFGLESHDSTPFQPKQFWERAPDPSPSQLLCHLCVCVELCREGLAIVQNTMPYRK